MFFDINRTSKNDKWVNALLDVKEKNNNMSSDVNSIQLTYFH